MNHPFEDILDQALAELKAGASTEQVLNRHFEHADELRPLLSVASNGLSISKNRIPSPMRKQKFAQTQSRFAWLNMAGLMRWSVIPLSLVIVLLGTKGVLDAAGNSLPNNRLYALKRASEKIQVEFTRDSNKQAVLQVELTQRRLNELKQASASNDPAQEAAALTELQDQSEKTFATVPQLAAAQALTNNSTLLDSLVAISKQQKDVVSAIANKPKPETTALAANTLNEVEKNRKSLAVIIATVQEQALAELKYKISVTGDAAINNDKTKITVDKTVFLIDQNTIINTKDGETLDSANLPARVYVTVVGSKENNIITAKVITVPSLSDDSDSGSVKGATTKPTTPTTKKPAIPSVTLPSIPPVELPPTPEENNKQANEVTSGFIVEEPSSQYAP